MKAYVTGLSLCQLKKKNSHLKQFDHVFHYWTGKSGGSPPPRASSIATGNHPVWCWKTLRTDAVAHLPLVWEQQHSTLPHYTCISNEATLKAAFILLVAEPISNRQRAHPAWGMPCSCSSIHHCHIIHIWRPSSLGAHEQNAGALPIPSVPLAPHPAMLSYSSHRHTQRCNSAVLMGVYRKGYDKANVFTWDKCLS